MHTTFIIHAMHRTAMPPRHGTRSQPRTRQRLNCGTATAAAAVVAATVVLSACVARAQLPVCCRDADNATLVAGCACLASDGVERRVTMAPGSTLRLHHVLGNLTALSVPDASRPRLEIAVSPCNHSAWLLANALPLSGVTTGDTLFPATANAR